jgi:acetolactate synthase-1/3 small subunit
MTQSALTVHFADRVGSLDRILSLLRRRGFPLGGITVERTHQPGIRRMTVGVSLESALPQVRRHLARLPDVVSVHLADGEAMHREYAMARVRCMPSQRAEILSLLSAFDGRPLSIGPETLVLEVTGFAPQLDALFAALRVYGIEESARTSPIALRRGEPRDQPTRQTTSETDRREK